ncbi:MAG: hypothetical protein WD768_05165, partial [Phycisphaeraceae bacterium]
SASPPGMRDVPRLSAAELSKSYQLGRLSARVVKDNAAGRAPDAKTIAQLRQVHAELGLPGDLPSLIAEVAEGDTRTLGILLLSRTDRAIQDTFRRDPRCSGQFKLGVQMIIVEGLLRADIGGLKETTRDEINAYVQSYLPTTASAAGCSDVFKRALSDFTKTLEGEEGVPTKSRAMWDELTKKMDRAEGLESYLSGEQAK